MSSIWSVRGVPPHLRRNIVKAASQAGVSVAEWLELAVAPAFEGDQPPRQPKFMKAVPPQASADDRADQLLAAIDTCLEDLEALTGSYDRNSQAH
ncbi:hypothetical protein ACTL6U_02510 [Rhodovibrionaceae bacterium A322]